MKPIYLKPGQTVAVVPMKEEPNVFPFGIAELVAGCGPAPFRPGEKCYVPETWGSNMVKGYEGYGKIFYRADMPNQKTVPETYGKPWRPPVTMPTWAARRFVTIVSCEPVRVSEIEEWDAKGTGIEIDGHWSMFYKKAFINYWHKRHPGKEWAWVIRTEENHV